jgi:hypothetical protein
LLGLPPFCWHFCWYRGDQTFTANFAIPEPLALIGSRTKLMQHWADQDQVDHWLDPKKVTPIKRGTQA